jgi:hypothetical protein
MNISSKSYIHKSKSGIKYILLLSLLTTLYFLQCFINYSIFLTIYLNSKMPLMFNKYQSLKYTKVTSKAIAGH